MRILIVLLFSVSCYGQCDYTMTDLPYSDQWCVDDVPLYMNPEGLLHPTNGCWQCLDDPRFFRFYASTDRQVEMWLSSDLYTTHPFINNVQVVFWTVFDGCPYEGGMVISHPSVSSNTNAPCWTYQDDVIALACFYNANGSISYAQECYEDPLVLGPRHNNYVVFDFQGGVDYWIAIYPACSPSDPWNNYGCIEVTFAGPNFLSLEWETQEEDEEEVIINKPVKIIHPRYGFLLVMPDGRIIDATFRQVRID